MKEAITHSFTESINQSVIQSKCRKVYKQFQLQWICIAIATAYVICFSDMCMFLPRNCSLHSSFYRGRYWKTQCICIILRSSQATWPLVYALCSVNNTYPLDSVHLSVCLSVCYTRAPSLCSSVYASRVRHALTDRLSCNVCHFLHVTDHYVSILWLHTSDHKWPFRVIIGHVW